ncbi:glycosyltransferase family 2 protein [Marinagarivorans cellulosilyticus]|uniref:Glycosyltransferase 2-like domain-containing protein n=1 Tax=Marinagarivorans cellulosilyticus TaxID=2721545 RepID=A0AAN1WIN4_9GAMM|nr:glycosyltransferase family 2 protein [Marinagarivorans cellulosilyticus]BCD98333.1 hypothetical protein MARGE09_P2534 [Marinagarivorans cellulosilyticus]
MVQKWLPKITVVTVVYNGATEIENTINSVLGQDYSNIEYIIVDGGSTDGTLEIIKRYESNISQWVSEPDKGIYDAMNKGIQMATGDVINFMNAGDRFASSVILSQVAVLLKPDSLKILYGDHQVLYPDGQVKVRRAKTLDKRIPRKMPCCHQSMFVPVAEAKSSPFDLTYIMAADFFQFLSIRNSGVGIINTANNISIVSSGGVSDTTRKTVWLEYKRAYRVFSGNSSHLYYGYNMAIEYCKVKIKNLVRHGH